MTFLQPRSQSWNYFRICITSVSLIFLSPWNMDNMDIKSSFLKKKKVRFVLAWFLREQKLISRFFFLSNDVDNKLLDIFKGINKLIYLVLALDSELIVKEYLEVYLVLFSELHMLKTVQSMTFSSKVALRFLQALHLHGLWSSLFVELPSEGCGLQMPGYHFGFELKQ